MNRETIKEGMYLTLWHENDSWEVVRAVTLNGHPGYARLVSRGSFREQGLPVLREVDTLDGLYRRVAPFWLQLQDTVYVKHKFREVVDISYGPQGLAVTLSALDGGAQSRLLVGTLKQLQLQNR